jgi:hypothetical protein
MLGLETKRALKSAEIAQIRGLKNACRLLVLD